MTVTEPGAPRSKPLDRTRAALFTYDDAVDARESDIYTGNVGSPETLERYAEWAQAGGAVGSIVKVLFRQEGENALSLQHVYLKPHRPVPRHSHDTDCLYIVLFGSLHMGNRVLKPCDGYYAPAEHAYTFTAGPIGAEYAEFRTSRSYDHRIKDVSDDTWKQLTEVVSEHRQAWEDLTTPPSRLATEAALEAARTGTGS